MEQKQKDGVTFMVLALALLLRDKQNSHCPWAEILKTNRPLGHIAQRVVPGYSLEALQAAEMEFFWRAMRLAGYWGHHRVQRNLFLETFGEACRQQGRSGGLESIKRGQEGGGERRG
jgi:hypothetical protein